MYQNAHGTTTRAQSREAPAADTQILRACAVEVHIDDIENHECTVNSSELAVHGRALQRSKHQLLFTYRKNPSVCPHCLGSIYIICIVHALSCMIHASRDLQKNTWLPQRSDFSAKMTLGTGKRFLCLVVDGGL